MRLYRSQIPRLAEDILRTLVDDGDIQVEREAFPEAEADIRAVMDEYLRTESRIVQEVREYMEKRQITYDQFAKLRTEAMEEKAHPQGDEGIRFIVNQILESFMISRHVDEVFSDDAGMRRKVMGIFKRHLVDDAELDREARGRLKHLREGTPAWDIEYRRVLEEVRRKRGLQS
ncbi:DUF507 family protein [Myxococcota bacterium]|nr:DUF507 family protein [Myxococcota bacterium]